MNDQNHPPLQEHVRWVNRIAVVEIIGDVDLNRSAQFQQMLLDLLDARPERIVINLAQVPYMDSSGVASLVKLMSRTRRSGTGLRLAALTERVRSLFEITRLDGVFEIFATVEEALA